MTELDDKLLSSQNQEQVANDQKHNDDLEKNSQSNKKKSDKNIDTNVYSTF